MACCGDVPTLETLAAVDLIRQHLPDLKVRVDQRRRPDAPAAGVASIRTDCPTAEFDALFTDRQADHLRLPRLSLADPPADLPADEPSQPPCPRLQGGRDDHDALRHGHAQRSRPLPPGDGRHRPGAGARSQAGALRQLMATSASQAAPTPGTTGRTRPRSATGSGRTRVWRMRILVVNAGSSTLKLGSSNADDSVLARSDLPVGRGRADDTAVARGRAEVREASTPSVTGSSTGACVHGACPDRLRAFEGAASELTHSAPLHSEVADDTWTRSPVCCQTFPRLRASTPRSMPTCRLPPQRFAVPTESRERWGARRYGFHGLSHAYAGPRSAEMLGPPQDGLRIVDAAIWGRGASLCAEPRRPLDGHDHGVHAVGGLMMTTDRELRRPGLVCGYCRTRLAPTTLRTPRALGTASPGRHGGHDGPRRRHHRRPRAARARPVRSPTSRGLASMAAAMAGSTRSRSSPGVGEHAAVRSSPPKGLDPRGQWTPSRTAAATSTVISARRTPRPSLVVEGRERTWS